MIGAQEKKIRRIMIAAPKSGSGKTMITCGLLQIFKENGEDISSCKCGPDYIDPMFHRQVLGIPARNLDTFFTGEDGTRRLFLRDRREDELVVMEGVMGLYDGLGGIRGRLLLSSGKGDADPHHTGGGCKRHGKIGASSDHRISGL